MCTVVGCMCGDGPALDTLPMTEESGLPLESGGVGRNPAALMLALEPMLEMRVPCGAWNEPCVGVAFAGLPTFGEGESEIVCG